MHQACAALVLFDRNPPIRSDRKTLQVWDFVPDGLANPIYPTFWLGVAFFAGSQGHAIGLGRLGGLPR